MKQIAMLALVSAGCLAVSAGTGTNELSLADNVTIHVAAGDTFTITNLTGYGWRLTKTGPGTLEIYAIKNPNAKITIEEGTLEVMNPVPDVLADAFFHVDASVASSLETTLIDGTNFVTRWNDVRGDGHPYASNVGKNDHKPFVNSSYPYGNVVDFGTTWNTNKTTGYGAAMKWSQALERTMDVFVVEQHNEDMREFVLDGAARGITGNPAYRNQAILGTYGAGADGAYQTLVPGNPTRGYDSCAIVLANARTANADYAFQFRVDGAAEMTASQAKSYYPGYDWHVYGLYPTGTAYLEGTEQVVINAFAYERGNVCGGQRIAECVAFDKLLTAEQREAVNRYLCLKWKPTALTGSFAELVAKSGTAIRTPTRGNMLAPMVFIDEGAIITDNGTFTPNTTISGSSLSALSGSVVYDPLLAADAWFHVDAAQTNLLGISSSAPTNVFCWSDVRGRKPKNGGDYPNDAGRYAWQVDGSYTFPFLNVNYLNGLPVMDFGPIWVEGDGTGEPARNRRRMFKWNTICETPRHFLIVVGDNEDAKLRSIDATTDHQKRNQAFIGNYSCSQTTSAHSGWPIFGRANRTSSTANSAYCLNVGSPSFRCDGQTIATPKTTPFPDGMHLVTIRPDESWVTAGDQRCNAFASERSHLLGGQRIAECLVFTNELATSERDLLEGLLLAKWFASNGVLRTYANVTVATNASLEMKYQRVAVTGRLTMGGTLKSEHVQVGDAATIELTAPCAIGGVLALPESDAATVTLVGDAWGNYFGETVKVLGATAVTGQKPVGVIDPNPHHVTVAFSIGADGLYATFLNAGTYIIVR